MKPRITKAVRDGWNEIHSMITCILENGDESQFECRNRGSVEGRDTGLDACQCEGCIATRNAWAAVAWINARL